MPLTNISINGLGLSAGAEELAYLAVDKFDATLRQNSLKKNELTFDSALKFNLYIANSRSYFSELFESTNPDLSRELFISADKDTMLLRLTDTIVRVGNGSIFGGLSINNQFPLAFEFVDNSCIDLDSYHTTPCPLLTITEETANQGV